MMRTQTPLPGKRGLHPAQIGAARTADDHRARLGSPTREKLLGAQKDAARALRLSGAPKIILEKLCACYGGAPIGGEIIVWPSNQWLINATGYVERTIQRAIAALVRLGLVVPKDSPRGYRYARRAPGSGDVIDAFGFILTPLIHRHAEFAGMVLEQDIERRERRRLDDDISRHRQAARAALAAVQPYDRAGAALSLTEALTRAELRIPRRDRAGDRRAVFDDLVRIRTAAEDLFYELARKEQHNQLTDRNMPGSACHNAVHLEQTSSVENSTETYKTAFRIGGGTVRENEQSHAVAASNADTEWAARMVQPNKSQLSLALVLEACPALLEADGHIAGSADLISVARKLRGNFGASPNAWEEAVARCGPEIAAVLAAYVYQTYCDEAIKPEGVSRTRFAQYGGLFRSLVRKTAKRDFDVINALLLMRRKRFS